MGVYTKTLRELSTNKTFKQEDVDSVNVELFSEYTYPIFDEAYRNVLQEKFIRHYYLYEINQPDVDQFKFQLNSYLRDVMDYYNKQYIALASLEPYKSAEWKKNLTRILDQNENSNSNKKGSLEQTVNRDGDVTVKNDATNTLNKLGDVTDTSESNVEASRTNNDTDKMTGTQKNESTQENHSANTGTVTNEGTNETHTANSGGTDNTLTRSGAINKTFGPRTSTDYVYPISSQLSDNYGNAAKKDSGGTDTETYNAYQEKNVMADTTKSDVTGGNTDTQTLNTKVDDNGSSSDTTTYDTTNSKEGQENSTSKDARESKTIYDTTDINKNDATTTTTNNTVDTTNNSNNEDQTSQREAKSVEDYVENVSGLQQSQSSLFIEYVSAINNIDLEIIEGARDLFMLLY